MPYATKYLIVLNNYVTRNIHPFLQPKFYESEYKMINRDDVKRFLLEHNWKSTTQQTYEQILCRYLDVWLEKESRDLAELDIVGFKSWTHSRGWNENVQYLASVVVRQFAVWRYGANHPLAKLRVKRKAPSPQNTLDEEEAATLMSSFSLEKGKGIRDRAIASLMLDTGIRAFEVCELQLKHLNVPRQSLKLITKGGTWQDKVYSPETAQYLTEWMDIREKFAKKGTNTAFVSTGGRTSGCALTVEGIKAIFRHIRNDLDIDTLSPHALRRTMATLSIRNGAPTRLVQLQGGWSDIRMVERYTQCLTVNDFKPYFPVSNLPNDETV